MAYLSYFRFVFSLNILSILSLLGLGFHTASHDQVKNVHFLVLGCHMQQKIIENILIYILKLKLNH